MSAGRRRTDAVRGDPRGVMAREVTVSAPTTDHRVEATIIPLHGGRAAGRCGALCTADGLASAFREHREWLLRRSRHILGDAGLAEDAVQETYLRAWRACATFDPERGPMLNWLAVILRNFALDMIKARARRPVGLHLVAIEGEPPAGSPDGADVVLQRADLRRALGRIDADHRAAVVETVLRDRPYEAVAVDLGVPVGTVKSRVHYALRRMAAVIQAEDAA
jgi:RNA polymerase sigma-70 factor, ECF subfamily